QTIGPCIDLLCIGNVPIGLTKLRVVEGIEELGAKLQVHALLDGRVFENSDVPIVQPWTSEETTSRVAETANGLRGKQRRVEVRFLLVAGIGDVQRTRNVIWGVDGQ